MTVRDMINKKLVILVLGPIARAILSAFVGYMTAKEVPPEYIDQFAQQAGAIGVILFNVCWELFDRRKVVKMGVDNAIAQFVAGVAYEIPKDR